MFFFKRTNMLRDAALAEHPPFPTGRLIGLFFLVFGVGISIQSFLLTPAQIIAILTSEKWQAVLNDASLPWSERILAISDIAEAMPWWVSVVNLFSTAALIAACIFFCRRVEKRSSVSMGFVKKGAVVEYLFGLVIGFFMLFAALELCALSGQVSMPWQDHFSLKYTPWASLTLFFVGYLIQGLSEELLCRSFLMVSMSRGHKPWVCVLTNSLLFSALHIFNTGISLLALLNLTLFGIFASVYTLRRGSIWGIAAIHSMWNFTQGNIFGISVSGMSQTPSLFYIDLSKFPSWFGGGSFGLEGSITVTAVLLVATTIVLMSPTKHSEIAESFPHTFSPQ